MKPNSTRTSIARVTTQRVVAFLLVVVPVAWAALRVAPPGAELVNTGGRRVLGDLLSSALHPALDRDFLTLVARATATTLSFAALGTAGALVIGAAGGILLSDATWAAKPPPPVRALRAGLRTVLVALRSIHELIWALLLVSVLGLDPLVAVLAIAVPFGAQTAKVFAETLDGLDQGPADAVRATGATGASVLAYALIPASAPLLIGYSFYRFECAVRTAVVLGVAGVGGLGHEMAVSLQSRNWPEVWTLIGAVLAISAVVDWWSSRLRRDLAVVSCAEWSSGSSVSTRGGVSRSVNRAWWSRTTAVIAVVGIAAAWVGSGVSLDGLTSARTRMLTTRLFRDMWPAERPRGGWSELVTAMFDTVAMAVVAMAIAVAVTLVVAPLATAVRRGSVDENAPMAGRAARRIAWAVSRAVLLVLRSVPPTVWAVIALLVLFPGPLPGAVALGLYTGGILGRLVAEAWESIDIRPRDALRAAGVLRPIASVASIVPPSVHQLTSYTLYRFEICVRETAVVGVVGAGGLGLLMAENLAAFRLDVVTTLLVASFTLSAASEMASRALRRALRA